MTVSEAKNVIYSEHNAPFGRLLIATSVLATKNYAGEVTIKDLLECLRRGYVHGKTTAVAELAALALYERTGRKRNTTIPYEDFDVNPESWESYLREHNDS